MHLDFLERLPLWFIQEEGSAKKKLISLNIQYINLFLILIYWLMSTDLYRKLNNINFSGDNYDIIVDYVLTGNLPSDFSEYKKGRYRRLFYKFTVEAGFLVYPIDSNKN